MRNYAVIGSILLLGMLLMATLQPATILRVETEEGYLALCRQIRTGAPITLTFTHSMHGGDVSETWALDDDARLIRQRIVTDNAAAAEYYATDGRVVRDGEGFTVLAGPFATDELIVRVDGIGNHRLTVEATTWYLHKDLRGPVQMRLAGERLPRSQVPDTCMATASDLHAKDIHT